MLTKHFVQPPVPLGQLYTIKYLEKLQTKFIYDQKRSQNLPCTHIFYESKCCDFKKENQQNLVFTSFFAVGS